MPTLVITNNNTQNLVIGDPTNTAETYKVAPAATLNVSVSSQFLVNVKDQLDALRIAEDENGTPLYDIDVNLGADGAGEFEGGLADATLWIANHIGSGVAVSNPSAASTVGARRVDHAAGEAYVGGAFFDVAGATNVTGDAEILEDGTDVSAVDLVAGEDVYQHFLLVNNAGTLEKVFVRGVSAASGSARPLERFELAKAVGEHLGLTGPSYAFVEAGQILFEESTGLTQTTTNFRWVPGSA